MLTSKQRAKLRSLAVNLKPVGQIGKEGITENLVGGLSDALEVHELIKITLLPASGDDGGNLALNLADFLRAELVAVIGRKAIFYRRSSREPFDHIVF